MTNAEKLQKMALGVSKMIGIEVQYRIGKFILRTDDNDEVNIPPAKITKLKQRFATIWSEVKALGNSISA